MKNLNALQTFQRRMLYRKVIFSIHQKNNVTLGKTATSGSTESKFEILLSLSIYIWCICNIVFVISILITNNNYCASCLFVLILGTKSAITN